MGVGELIGESGGRRYVLTMCAGAAVNVLQWFGKLDAQGTTYAWVMIATVAAYITGNTAQKIQAPPPPPPLPPLPPLPIPEGIEQ